MYEMRLPTCELYSLPESLPFRLDAWPGGVLKSVMCSSITFRVSCKTWLSVLVLGRGVLPSPEPI